MCYFIMLRGSRKVLSLFNVIWYKYHFYAPLNMKLIECVILQCYSFFTCEKYCKCVILSCYAAQGKYYPCSMRYGITTFSMHLFNMKLIDEK